MNHRRFNIGPGAASLILIIIVLSMSTLGILTLMNARSDYSLSERSLAVAQSVYALNEQAENHLAQLDAILKSASDEAEPSAYLDKVAQALPEGMTLDDDCVFWTEADEEGRELFCKVRIGQDAGRSLWAEHRLSIQISESEMDDLWN